MFPTYLQIPPYLQMYRSVSPDLQICIVTLSHTYTRRGNPTPTLREIRNRELRARNARHPKSSVQQPTISSIYSTYTLSRHPHYKINYSRSIAEDRTRWSGGVQHRSLHDVDMAPESLIDLPRVPVLFVSSSSSTIAADALHTHKRNGTHLSGIRTRTALFTVTATRLPLSMPHDLPRVQPPHCSLMRPSCSLSSPMSTMAGDALRTH
jgi:hypothetical protein